jgi:hypothetical protein
MNAWHGNEFSRTKLTPTLILPHKRGRKSLGLVIKFLAGFVDLTGGPVNTYKAAVITPVRQYGVLLRITKIPVGRIGDGLSAEIRDK